jgi:serine protease inhibitor
VIISPVSIQTALTMTMFGAAGKTKTEMMDGLKYPISYSDDSIANSFSGLTKSFKSENGLKIGKYDWLRYFPLKF